MSLTVSFVLFPPACDPPLQELGAPRGLIGYPHYNLLLGEGGTQQKRGSPTWRKEGREEEDGGAVHYGPDSCRWMLRAPTGYTLNVTVLHLDVRPQDHIKVSQMITKDFDSFFFYVEGSIIRTYRFHCLE